ncbi:MAG: hypothetical protein EBS48_06545 [Actinobacteria bacterium]|nr:hypothetical protein [Actinomycetota bacterium]
MARDLTGTWIVSELSPPDGVDLRFVALALTGVAGPDEQDGRPAGTLCVAAVFPDGSTVTTTAMLPGVRDQMRQMSVITALDFLRKQLLGSHAAR